MGLTIDMIRVFIVTDRAGLYEQIIRSKQLTGHRNLKCIIGGFQAMKTKIQWYTNIFSKHTENLYSDRVNSLVRS